MKVRMTFELKGVVQGIGFRPAVWRMARESALGGWVRNESGRTLLQLCGEDDKVIGFMESLPERLPRCSRLESVKLIKTEDAAEFESLSFSILPGNDADERDVVIPPDIAMCPDCSNDIVDPSNRRHRYPFTTCAVCGPRYTIVNRTPYERANTTMAAFPLCQECKEEYGSPADRRFNAETIACPKCGPQLFMANTKGTQLLVENPMLEARLGIAAGKILALRSIGGFHLAADAFNRTAIETLRKRKRRLSKPFAVMARDIDTVKAYCVCPPDAEALLLSPEAPIVILELKDEGSYPRELLPADLICPDGPTLGVMLPPSPLHRLLFEKASEDDDTPQFDMLIMTSGNRGGEPICISNEEAFARLSEIADIFLCHDREINLRNDDSICVARTCCPQVWRRARGYAPAPLILKSELKRNALAMGCEVRTAIAMGYSGRIVMSPHIGDLDTPEAIDCLLEHAGRLPLFLDKTPHVIATDLDPNLRSSMEGERLAQKYSIPIARVQRQHAHALSCMAEHGLSRSLALVFGCSGLGSDGRIWGAELMECIPEGFRRIATFAPARLPGGDTATTRPARQLIGRFQASGIKLLGKWLERLNLDEAEPEIWYKQCEKGLNSPESHSAGSLFDAVSALLGLAPDFVGYDGQTSMRVEYAAMQCLKGMSRIKDSHKELLSFDFREDGPIGMVDWSPMFKAFEDPSAIDREGVCELAASFHFAVADAIMRMIGFGASKSDCRDLVLSGSLFMNGRLSDIIEQRLSDAGFNVWTHCAVPPNGGGLCVGQALAAGMG